MSTVPPCPEPPNHLRLAPTEKDVPAFEDDHQRHREMVVGQDTHAVDVGDDAVNAEAATAEARLRAAFPDVDAIQLVREQGRYSTILCGAEFVTRWRIYLADVRSSEGDTLDAAVNTLLSPASS